MSKEFDRTATSNPSATANSPRKNKKILVVDDEKDIVDTVAYNLRRHGYDVVTAYDGTVALEAAARENPDLILLDLMLPGLDGMEVARRLKADPRTAGTPLVMLTAKGEEADVVIGLTLGADD
ncbi:MAG: response regulator, partial [Phycisphaerae bacterium]|nr:response regulator [Phycisphaerae bacterium]